MSTQRMIEFETASEEGAGRVSSALAGAFAALQAERPDGVRLAYWRVRGGRRFVALIELAEEDANPLLDVAATRMLPGVIGEYVTGGYPRPEVVQTVGSFGFHW